MAGDPLGSMRLSSQGIVDRDELVFRAALHRSVPIAMVTLHLSLVCLLSIFHLYLLTIGCLIR